MIGIVFGHAGMSLAGGILEKSYHYPFTGAVWLNEELYIVTGALIIGIVAATIPAIQGSRTELHKTLAEN